jgi:lipopolysaccharide export system protein LptA
MSGLHATLANLQAEARPATRSGPLAPLVVACIVALTTLGIAPAAAEKADREKEIQILADRLTADEAKREAVYDGSVVITQGTLRVTANRIVVREDAEGYKTFIATGTPVTFRQKRDKVDEWVDGEAQRAEFDDRSDILKLFQAARLKTPQGELTGDYVSYDRGKEFVVVTGVPGAQPGTPGARVKATIIPPKKDGKGAEGGTPAKGAPKNTSTGGNTSR